MKKRIKKVTKNPVLYHPRPGRAGKPTKFLGRPVKIGMHDDAPYSDFDPLELAMGIKEEREHTDDWVVAESIARDHLVEDPQYYSKLQRTFGPPSSELQSSATQPNPTLLSAARPVANPGRIPIPNDPAKVLIWIIPLRAKSKYGNPGFEVEILTPIFTDRWTFPKTIKNWMRRSTYEDWKQRASAYASVEDWKREFTSRTNANPSITRIHTYTDETGGGQPVTITALKSYKHTQGEYTLYIKKGESFQVKLEKYGSTAWFSSDNIFFEIPSDVFQLPAARCSTRARPNPYISVARVEKNTSFTPEQLKGAIAEAWNGLACIPTDPYKPSRWFDWRQDWLERYKDARSLDALDSADVRLLKGAITEAWNGLACIPKEPYKPDEWLSWRQDWLERNRPASSLSTIDRPIDDLRVKKNPSFTPEQMKRFITWIDEHTKGLIATPEMTGPHLAEAFPELGKDYTERLWYAKQIVNKYNRAEKNPHIMIAGKKRYVDSPMDYEYARLDYMTDDQLETRVNRITDPDKMRRFIKAMREERKPNRLIRMAQMRLRHLNPTLLSATRPVANPHTRISPKYLPYTCNVCNVDFDVSREADSGAERSGVVDVKCPECSSADVRAIYDLDDSERKYSDPCSTCRQVGTAVCEYCELSPSEPRRKALPPDPSYYGY